MASVPGVSAEHPETAQGTRRRHLLAREIRALAPFVIVALLVVVAMVLLGQEAERHMDAIEAWIGQLGKLGMLIFILLVVVGTSLLVPESLFGLAAGALFGLVWGILVMLVGNLLACALQFALAHRWLRGPIQRALDSRPLLRAIQKAVVRDELRLQAMLRLTPLNPALISYLLGAAGVRFAGFMLVSPLLAAHFVLEVYLGHAGKQLLEHGLDGGSAMGTNTVLAYAAGIIGIAAIVLVSRTAHRAVLRALNEQAAANDTHPSS